MDLRLRICKGCAQRMPSTALVEDDELGRRLVDVNEW